jgi:uncharacterized protein YjbI with pentapeptide repeats
MADQRQLQILQRGVPAWNRWRGDNPAVIPDLRELEMPGAALTGANLSRTLLIDSNLKSADLQRARLEKAILGAADLSDANLSGAGLTGAELHAALLENTDLTRAMLDHAIFRDAALHGAKLMGASMLRTIFKNAHMKGADLRGTSHNHTDFSGADLRDANFSDTFAGGGSFAGAKLGGARLGSAVLSQADLNGADLEKAILRGADLTGANLENANLSGADLGGADLSKTQLARANLTKARIVDCAVFGVSAWGAELKGAIQRDLRITDLGEPLVVVDDLELAQFTYLLIQNRKLRTIINEIASKIVLILGHFPGDREAILKAMREAIREAGYTPVLFDSEPRRGREIIEIMWTLARMARFVIADFTEASSVPHELRAVVPDLPHVPVQPLLMAGESEGKVIDQLRRNRSVLSMYRYKNAERLIDALHSRVLEPAEAMARELMPL